MQTIDVTTIREDIKRLLMQENYEIVNNYVKDKLPKLAVEIMRTYFQYPFPNRHKLKQLFCAYRVLSMLEIFNILKAHISTRRVRKVYYKLRARILQFADSNRCKLDTRTQMLFELLVATETIWNDLLKAVYNKPFGYNKTFAPIIDIGETSKPKLKRIFRKRTVNTGTTYANAQTLFWKSYYISWFAHLYLLVANTFEFREPNKEEFIVNCQFEILNSGRDTLKAILHYRPQYNRITSLNSIIIFLLLFWNFYTTLLFLLAMLGKDFNFSGKKFYPIRATMYIHI